MVRSRARRGELLPRLHFDAGRFVEAAIAYSALSERPDPNGPAPPDSSASALPPPAASSLEPLLASAAREALASRQRSLEIRISHISMALHSSAGAGGSSSEGLGANFVKALEENAQRAQLQLKLATELSALVSSPPRLQAPSSTPARCSLRAALALFHAQVCSAARPQPALLRRMGRLAVVAAFSYSTLRSRKEYPQCVTVALQHILAQPPEVWAAGGVGSGGVGGVGGVGGGGGHGAELAHGMTMPWAELMRDVSELRRRSRATTPSTRCDRRLPRSAAALDAAPRAGPRGQAALWRELPRRQARRAVGHALPVLRSADRCGPLMKSLWEGSRPLLGSAARQRLHLIAGLGVLLSDWLEESRAPTADRALLPAFAAATRRLGVSADLQRMLSELDAVEALVSDDRPLAQSTDLQRRTLRRLLQELSAIGQY